MQELELENLIFILQFYIYYINKIITFSLSLHSKPTLSSSSSIGKITVELINLEFV